MSGAEYSRALARVAVAQIAELAGFDAAHDSAVDILGDLLQRYIANVCTSAHEYAESAGRTHTNTMDALLALEDLGVTPDELDVFTGLMLQGGSVPFAHAVARYPVTQQVPGPPTFQDRHEPHPAHIPAHLPAFPDVHTYQHTPAFQGHEVDAQRQRKMVLASNQQAEAALVKLHQRLVATAATTTAAAVGPAASQPGTNPFLLAPVVVAAADADADAGAGADAAAEAGASGALETGVAADFSMGAAQRVFQRVLSPEEQRQQKEAAAAAGNSGTTMMDLDGPAAGQSDAGGRWVLWSSDAPAVAGGDGAGGGALLRQELLQLQWHDASKAASVLGAAARQRPPDAYQERAEAAMAAEGAVGGRQRKSAYGRGNAELQRADELLRAGHAGGVGGMDEDV